MDDCCHLARTVNDNSRYCFILRRIGSTEKCTKHYYAMYAYRMCRHYHMDRLWLQFCFWNRSDGKRQLLGIPDRRIRQSSVKWYHNR